MSKPVIAILVTVLILLCCLCSIALVAASLWFFPASQSVSIESPGAVQEITATPQLVRPIPRPTQSFDPESPTPPGTAEEALPTAAPFPEPAFETLETLNNALVPINDIPDLARRLENKTGIPLTLPAPEEPFEVGAQKSFWVTNTDDNRSFQIEATLRYVTDKAYFWIQDGVSYRDRELRDLAETFSNRIYPTNREFFGSEWSPGVDGDPRLFILYARGIGSGVAGYFSSRDSFHPDFVQYSNGHEMFFFNADRIDFDQEFTYGVLAHEFQHMIHWYRDRNESTWLNEGFSDLAMQLNGYTIGGHDFLYALDPDIQLNDWPNDPSQTSPHYGASFLFTTYFLDRFGEEATQALVAHPDNGMSSIDAVLAELALTDPLSGETLQADHIFGDWVVTNYLLDPTVADGRYAYTNYADPPIFDPTETIRNCDSGNFTRTVQQYGVDYIELRCRGDYNLHFEGSTLASVLPEDPYSGAYAFWSNKGDESDMTLTRSFDLRQADGPLTLSYRTWYDIEADYDYLYLVASTDGENWDMLRTPAGTDSDPTGANYGWAYNGLSGGGDQAEWIYEEVDLSQYAGQEVQIRFEYITDAAVNGEGLLLDDISLPAIDYFSDFETDAGGWEAAGFVRIQNSLPQTYRLALITEGSRTTVQNLDLAADNTLSLPLSFDGDIDSIVLVVSGVTRFTRQPAAYRITLE